jgi:hypothetical protein
MAGNKSNSLKDTFPFLLHFSTNRGVVDPNGGNSPHAGEDGSSMAHAIRESTIQEV